VPDRGARSVRARRANKARILVHTKVFPWRGRSQYDAVSWRGEPCSETRSRPRMS
jgi:hypothetical protein